MTCYGMIKEGSVVMHLNLSLMGKLVLDRCAN